MANDSTRASLELLYHVSRELAAALDLRTVLQRVLFLSLRNVGGERGSIVVLDDHGVVVDSAIVYGVRVHSHTTQQLRETVDRGLAGWVVRNRKAVLLPDTSRDERWLRRPDDANDRSGAKSAICVPVMARERLVGVLTVVHPEPGFFGEEHLALIQAIADQAGIAVLNARLYEDSQRQARVMTALAESAVAMTASLQLSDVLQRILEQTANAMRVETVLLALINESRQELEIRAASGERGWPLVGQHVPLGEGIYGQVASSGQGIILTRAADNPAAQIPGLQVRALVCAPVHAQGRIIGVLEAVNPRSGPLDPDALLVLSGIGSLAGIAIQNATLYGQVDGAQQRYHELFEDSIDPILITNCSGIIQEANRQAGLNSGFDQSALRGMNIDQVHKIVREKTGDDFERIHPGEIVSYESSLCTASKNHVPVQVYVRRVMIDDADCLQWILRDISERKALDTLREDLMAMIYHDLRSPLANVVSSLDVMETMLPAESSPNLRGPLRIAQRSTDRIQRLISSLLDVHRLEAGQPIVNQTSTDPLTLLSEAVDIVRPPSEAKQQTVQVNTPETLPAVWIDADMLRRVLVNLLENAVKYSPTRSQIEVGASADTTELHFWVQDRGQGIPPEQQQAIFEKFARLHAEPSTKGLGLGLAFCRLAVETHGGRIWVESTPGAGSRFQFTLPVQNRAQASAGLPGTPS
ncbi:MAG TPA: GAF domain-containing protein [Anaerolineaceae bacterium]